MNNISLKQFVVCEKNKSKVFVKVNCTEWTVDEKGDCIPFCTLKNKNVTGNDCRQCKERKPLAESTTKEQPVTFADQLKEKLPQYNFYSKDKMQNQDNTQTQHTFLSKAAQYAKTEGSQLIEGKVSEEVFEKRKALCMQCPRRLNPTPDKEQIGWCATCGCSAKNPRAALSNKLWMPNLLCPLNKFPQEIGEGFNVGDAVNSVKGAIQSVASLFKSEGNT
jgi:hypothetical protein